MKVITFDNARTTWLFPLEEFAPSSGANPPSILNAIAERYKFTQKPDVTTREDMNKNGLVFGIGQFATNGVTATVNDFAICNDGIVAICRTTELGEAFLNDVFRWVIDEFGFREVKNNRRLYNSTVVVEFEQSPARLVAGYESLIRFIDARIKTVMSKPANLQFSRLDFEMDKRELADGQVVTPKFILERRGGIDFSQERYFSAATMRTEDHIAVLTEIERLAAALSTGSQRPS
jgi:hypothetical protein